jgi:hypothetical protein
MAMRYILNKSGLLTLKNEITTSRFEEVSALASLTNLLAVPVCYVVKADHVEVEWVLGQRILSVELNQDAYFWELVDSRHRLFSCRKFSSFDVLCGHIHDDIDYDGTDEY